jgi:hypothetical protein
MVQELPRLATARSATLTSDIHLATDTHAVLKCICTYLCVRVYASGSESVPSSENGPTFLECPSSYVSPRWDLPQGIITVTAKNNDPSACRPPDLSASMFGVFVYRNVRAFVHVLVAVVVSMPLCLCEFLCLRLCITVFRLYLFRVPVCVWLSFCAGVCVCASVRVSKFICVSDQGTGSIDMGGVYPGGSRTAVVVVATDGAGRIAVCSFDIVTKGVLGRVAVLVRVRL